MTLQLKMPVPNTLKHDSILINKTQTRPLDGDVLEGLKGLTDLGFDTALVPNPRASVLLMCHRHPLPQPLDTPETDQLAYQSILKVRHTLQAIDELVDDLPIFREALTHEAVDGLPSALGDSFFGVQGDCVWIQGEGSSRTLRPFYAAETQALNTLSKDLFIKIQNNRLSRYVFNHRRLQNHPLTKLFLHKQYDLLKRFQAVQIERYDTLLKALDTQGFRLAGIIFGYQHQKALTEYLNRAGVNVYAKNCS